jgi:hypothetical protein
MTDILTDPSAKLTNEQLSALFKKRGVSVSPETIAGWPEAGIPTDPSAMLSRKTLAAALTAVGYRTSATTLASLASRGGGPIYRLWGPYVVHEWGDGLKWAQARLSAKRANSAEGRELDRARAEPPREPGATVSPYPRWERAPKAESKPSADAAKSAPAAKARRQVRKTRAAPSVARPTAAE